MAKEDISIRDCEKEIAELTYNIMTLEYEHAEQDAIRDLACNAVNDGDSGGIDFQIFKSILILLGAVYLIFALISLVSG